jgi:hypothetical protein
MHVLEDFPNNYSFIKIVSINLSCYQKRGERVVIKKPIYFAQMGLKTLILDFELSKENKWVLIEQF